MISDFFHQKLVNLFVKTNGAISRVFFTGVGHIITLHRVLPASPYEIPENKALEITPEKLEHLISIYKRYNYTFVTPDTLYEILMQKKKVRGKVAVLTFDDGYNDIYTHSLPVLKSHNIPFCIYITSGFQDKTALPWWYMIDILLKGKNEIILHKAYQGQVLKCRDAHEKQKTFLNIRQALMEDYGHCEGILNEIFAANNCDYHKSLNYIYESCFLSWEQIKYISTHHDVCIGAHTVSHPKLNKLSEQEIIDEVIHSKKIIESHIQKEVQHFAYPHGGISEVGKREFEILKNLPFRTCTTTRQSNIFKCHRNHTECLPRIYFSSKSTEERIKFNLNGISQFQYNGIKKCITD